MTLCEAAEKGDIEQLIALLDAGADPNERGEDKNPALYVAVDEKQLEAVRILLDRGADVNAVNSSGGTVLSHAAFITNLPLVRLLLDRGADPSIQDVSGGTALMWTGRCNSPAAEKRMEVRRLVVAHGADVNAINSEGATALAYAAVEGDLPLVEFCWSMAQTPMPAMRTTTRP